MTASVVICLRKDDGRDRHRLMVLERCPDGSLVRIEIANRPYPTLEAADWLHTHAARLLIEISGRDPAAVQRFVDAARLGREAV